MSDILDEAAFQAMAPWGREARVVPLDIAREQVNSTRETAFALGRTMPMNHMKQSIEGCVTCPRRWNEHTDEERGAGDPR